MLAAVHLLAATALIQPSLQPLPARATALPRHGLGIVLQLNGDGERGDTAVGGLGARFTQLRGVVTPTTQSKNAAAPAPAKEEEEGGEMSIKELLTEYGVIALLFHFTVWTTCLVSVYSILSFGVDIDSLLPDWARASDGEGGAAAAGAAGKIAATLGLVEAIGPARLALTVAATPGVSKRARQYAVVRDTEEFVAGAWDRVFGGGERE